VIFSLILTVIDVTITNQIYSGHNFENFIE